MYESDDSRNGVDRIEETEAKREQKKSSGYSSIPLVFVEFLMEDLRPIAPPDKTKEYILLFFKHYDPEKEELRFVGRMFVKSTGRPIEILSKLNKMAGYAPDEEINLYEGHQEIVKRLVDLIGITSVIEVLIRLIGAYEHMYSNYKESMQWIEDTDVLEMIGDKFSSLDYAEVHANAAETLCAITRFAPPGLAAKITSPNFTGRLFRHALEDSRPKSVLVNSLSVCISLLDPKRLTVGIYHTYHQVSQGSMISAKPETVEGMLESLGL